MAGSGGCDCQGVRYRTDADLRPVINCHCGRCRRITGHFMAASGCPEDSLVVDSDEALKWYEAAPGVFYGFCSRCGSTLFWRSEAGDGWISIAAGTLDQPTGLRTESAWWTAEAADYHLLDPAPVNYPYEPGGEAGGSGPG